MTKPKEQHQVDLLYMAHDCFKGNTHKYILTGIDVASRYKFVKPHKTKKLAEIALHLMTIYKKGGVLKYPRVIQYVNCSEFKGEVTKLLQKHNVEIRKATMKYKRTHTAFIEAFNNELAKLLFKPMDI